MTELLTSISSRAADPGSQSCCLKVRIARTAASYRLSASTSTVCRRPSVSRYVTLHDATARSLTFSMIFDNYRVGCSHTPCPIPNLSCRSRLLEKVVYCGATSETFKGSLAAAINLARTEVLM